MPCGLELLLLVLLVSCLLPCKTVYVPSAKATECSVPMFSAWRRKTDMLHMMKAQKIAYFFSSVPTLGEECSIAKNSFGKWEELVIFAKNCEILEQWRLQGQLLCKPCKLYLPVLGVNTMSTVVSLCKKAIVCQTTCHCYPLETWHKHWVADNMTPVWRRNLY